MSIIPASFFSKELQDVAPAVPLLEENDTSNAEDFDTYLKSLLVPDSANQVSEEELFAALISERLKNLKGEETASEYNSILSEKKNELMRADGYVPFEDAAKAALRKLGDLEKISSQEADQIYSQSFNAAQLDDNKNALYDNRGSANDPTIATASLEQALFLARQMIEQYDNGETEPTPPASPLNPAANSTNNDSSNIGTSSIPKRPKKESDDVPDLALSLQFPSQASILKTNDFLLESLLKIHKK